LRFHLVGIPFTNTNTDFPDCAFTMKVRKFAKMMKAAGHKVYLYSGPSSTAECDEHIQCFTEEERIAAVGMHHTSASYDGSLPHWQKFNKTVAQEIKKRAEQKDFVCVISGLANKQIADELPEMMVVEFGIGYPGTFSKYRVFESYAWMHSVYGTTTTNAANLNGKFYDAVIPGYIDKDEFPAGKGEGDYFLFIGRLIERKGFQIAADVAEHLGKRLLVAGHGTPPSYGEYVGVVNKTKAELYANAKAIFAPTLYIEPFGNIVPEAAMTGTPAITTDWGAFTETVEDGVTGFRCHTFGEFIDAAKKVKDLDRNYIRERAIKNYSLEATAPKYEKYFSRLLTLWGDGWNTVEL
jgi:glycosyltransferase involved in cell wall biosynthesis